MTNTWSYIGNTLTLVIKNNLSIINVGTKFEFSLSEMPSPIWTGESSPPVIVSGSDLSLPVLSLSKLVVRNTNKITDRTNVIFKSTKTTDVDIDIEIGQGDVGFESVDVTGGTALIKTDRRIWMSLGLISNAKWINMTANGLDRNSSYIGITINGSLTGNGSITLDGVGGAGSEPSANIGVSVNSPITSSSEVTIRGKGGVGPK